MKFKIEKLPIVESEISALEQKQQDLLKSEYKKIEQQGIEYVRVKSVQSKIFEIKSDNIRSLFRYQEGRVVLIGVVFVKKTQKTPKNIIRLAKKRFKDVYGEV